jgi:hypothetical protein
MGYQDARGCLALMHQYQYTNLWFLDVTSIWRLFPNMDQAVSTSWKTKEPQDSSNSNTIFNNKHHTESYFVVVWCLLYTKYICCSTWMVVYVCKWYVCCIPYVCIPFAYRPPSPPSVPGLWLRWFHGMPPAAAPPTDRSPQPAVQWRHNAWDHDLPMWEDGRNPYENI